jgi:hypothetical protein
MIGRRKNLFEFDHIKKFDQGQKPSKWAQLLGTSVVARRSIDFSGPRTVYLKPFTGTLFPGILFRVFTIWVPPVLLVCFS